MYICVYVYMHVYIYIICDHVQINLIFTNFQNFMLSEKSGVIVVYLSVEYSYFLIVMIWRCARKNIFNFIFVKYCLWFTNGILQMETE